jgi:adenosyl cobinamide kinase/adenosyl cobinamide phosphate guanylyltransferase
LRFAEIDYGAYRLFVATGATDDEVAAWIGEHAKKRSRADIVVWNNRLRDQRLSDLSPELQEMMEEYIAASLPRNRVVYHWFDVYDLEEERL